MRTRSNRRSSAASKHATPASHNGGISRRGRPPKKVFINVEIKATTRDNLNQLKRRTGLRNQGEVLDLLIASRLRELSGKTQMR